MVDWLWWKRKRPSPCRDGRVSRGATPLRGLPGNKNAPVTARFWESQPHSFAGTAPTGHAAGPIPSARITVAAPARTTAPRCGGSAGDSQAHSASALVSGFQPMARLSGTPLRCLLFLILVFGGIGCWLFYSTQWRICQAEGKPLSLRGADVSSLY